MSTEQADVKLAPELEKYIQHWKKQPGNLIMVLHRVQGHYGYVPRAVAFQVDDLDGQTATGWSVLVPGRTGPWSGEVPVISPWAPGRREVAVAIEPTSWSGRSVSADEGV